MPTFLLTWKKWTWTDLPQAVARTANGDTYRQKWTVAAHKQIRPGDRVFVIRLGKEYPGIIASGHVFAGPMLEPHWDAAQKSRMVHMVAVDLDKVVAPENALPRAQLRGGALDAAHWAPQSSGIRIPDEAAARLEELWSEWLRNAANGSMQEATGTHWSRREVDAIVRDYFDMLAAEFAGRPYNKTEHRRTLMAALPGRSGPSIEFKHRNISAVLAEEGLPYIDGYKPASNYQDLLGEAVAAYLREHPEVLGAAVDADLAPAVTQPKDDYRLEDVLEPAPTPVPPQSKHNGADGIKRRTPHRPSKELGDAGERFVLRLEKRYLHEHGRDDLAARVEWVACTKGDGFGYDILSFDEHGAEKYIEVKTTTLSKNAAFYLTANEYDLSHTQPEKFRLYRVYNFRNTPKLYMLSAPLDNHCGLEPVVYIVHPR